ncbi:MAG TPA: type IV pilus secretin PilQ [Candidatus Saccharicenans sp.]|jgi:type IV pilus assembly protein PilQ|nr:type IV pilus secretin PilQ [Candidatus Saccharicenans sp.]HOP59947.1 type IV pilus secretin PilQ [Candidatus Saccharicenans sp.]HPU93567.1 type IV pilus secretin PilQ [Candidatus Saccharicenans sp.]
MKRKNLWLVLAIINLIMVPGLALQAASAATDLSKIEVIPGALSTRVVMIADKPLTVRQAAYISETPPVLVLELSGVRPVEIPARQPVDGRLVKEIRVEPAGEHLKVLLSLKEKVPYRLGLEQGKLFIELNEFLKAADYPLDSALNNLLKKESQVYFSEMKVEAKPGKVNFKISLSGEAPVQTFALNNPDRLVVDLLNTQYPRGSQSYQVGQAKVDKVRVGQFKQADPCPITRLVFELKEAGWYSLDNSAEGLNITFYSPEDVLTASNQVTSKEESPVRPVANSSLANALPVPASAREVKEEVPATPDPVRIKPQPAEAKIEAAPAPKKARASSAPEQAQPQQEKFKPRVIQSSEEKYTGEIISLKFKDADIRDVILFLADLAGLNVIFDPEVRGTVSCNLQAVPWDQALDVVLKQNKLGKTIEGNVLRIAPVEVLAREDEDIRRIQESKELAGPIQVKTVTLSYSKARDVQSLLKSKLSRNGEIVIDERTNTLIISEVRDRMELLEKLIGVLDTPTPQVSIEARIVEATSTFIKNLGIQWGFKGIADPFYGNQTSISFPNKIQLDGSMIPQGIVTKGIGGPLGGYAVNLPAPAFNTAVGFSFANVLDTFRLDVALSGLETSGNGRIISSPKVTTQNNQAAEIIQGRQIPVQTVANFTVTTRYVNAALELRATPQITAEGTIIMNIEIQNNAADFANLVNGIPPITTQSAKTTVMVPDGGTTVIGGIYRTEDSITRDKTPYLNNIPILGTLFRSFARTRQNRELLIFITPRIMK